MLSLGVAGKEFCTNTRSFKASCLGRIYEVTRVSSNKSALLGAFPIATFIPSTAVINPWFLAELIDAP